MTHAQQQAVPHQQQTMFNYDQVVAYQNYFNGQLQQAQAQGKSDAEIQEMTVTFQVRLPTTETLTRTVERSCSPVPCLRRSHTLGRHGYLFVYHRIPNRDHILTSHSS